MTVSRRHLLGKLATTATTGVVFQALSNFSLAATARVPRVSLLPGTILLSRNENAYGPSDKVLVAMREALSDGNRYPETEHDSLLNKLAVLHGVRAQHILLGCGSSEILRIAAAAFLGPGKKLVQASPTCPLLGRFARSSGAEVVNVPLNKMYGHDLDVMLARTDASTGLVYLCNPNNPTGALTTHKDIETFIGKLPASTMVLIDEAYHHFVSTTSAYSSFLDRPCNDNRVMVVRTFSKIYGLAGMRIGYVVATPDIARRLSEHGLQFAIGAVSAKAATAALDDSEYVSMAAKRNANDRQEFMNQVNARMLRALDSHANFVMMKSPYPVDMVFEHLKKNNIVVAPPIPEMNKYIRVSLGTPADMLQFWRVWDLMSGQKMDM
jgi:histidinol-phosphate aminotransferase